MRCRALVYLLLIGATRPTVRDCADCPEMVQVPAGRYTATVPLARIDGPPSGPPRVVPTARVAVAVTRAFRIARSEVTVGQYRAFVVATRRPDPGRCFVFETIEADGTPRFGWRDGAGWRSPGYHQQDDFPATCIRWIDAQAYADWLSARTGKHYRLPSETEWELAARGGSDALPPADPVCAHANGADLSLKRAYPGLRAFADCDDGAVFAASVGSYRSNGLGLVDMRGNLWEWTGDCDHRSYVGMPTDGTAWTKDGDCSARVRRGGSWYRASGDDRSTLPVADAHGNAGFRVVEGRN